MASAAAAAAQSEIYIPEEWSLAADSIAYDSITSPPPVIVVCGPGNCWKTMFSRYLLNVFMQRYEKVGYLDTDVGQTEFTPPGFVSLTVLHEPTPDLTIPCLKTPERCLYFGDVSAKSDPSLYLKSIFSLYNYYRKEYCFSYKGENHAKTELPLIVNTSGWVKGFGYNMLLDMLKHIAPTHVVKLNTYAEDKNLPAGAFWSDGESNTTVHLVEINSAQQDSFKKSLQKDSRLLREFRIMAYFRQCFPRDANITTIKELAHAVASHRPCEVPIASVKIKHLHCEVPTSEMFHSLNASIVGLAVDSGESDNLPWCFGLGIVRGIDTFKGVLSVITPVSQSSLEKVNLLLQGNIQIPPSLLQVQGCISPYMSANTLNGS